MDSQAPLNDQLNDQTGNPLRLRWEAVETFRAQELASMTDERARDIIRMLGAVQGWRERTDWSGLVEQQTIFRRARHP